MDVMERNLLVPPYPKDLWQEYDILIEDTESNGIDSEWNCT